VRVLHLITARGGSKGVPRKNLRQVGGRSLIGWKAVAAQRSAHCSRLIISTDSEEIQAEARRHGVEVPFTRPAELASDTASSGAVMAHAMEYVEGAGERYDALMLHQPTSPFTRPADLDAAVALMASQKACSVVGMRRMETSSLFVGPMDEQGRISAIVEKIRGMPSVRRQDLQPEFTLNGALYLLEWSSFRAHQNIFHDPARTYGHLMPAEYSVDIDDLTQLDYAQFLVETGRIDSSLWG
jgi:CMP-N,N'-diacetyllegionaminic acid synthase